MASFEADDWRFGLSLLQRQQHLLDGQYGSDVTFLVCKHDKKKVIKAHKFPLIAGSAVFEAMIDRWTVDSCKPIVITDTEPSTFKTMLRFLYSEVVTLTGDNVMSLLYLSKKYLISQLTKLCVKYLKNQINNDNVCTILDETILYNEAELAQKCTAIISKNAEKIITSKRFRQLRHESLVEILKRDDWQGPPEVEIYKACMEWADDQCGRDGKAASDENRRAALGEALYQIRFPAMSSDEFAEATNDSQLLTWAEKTRVYEHMAMHGNQMPTCNCKVKFNMKPRVVKVTMVTVNRFSQSGVQCGWPAQGRTYAIDFVCNKHATLQGVGLYTLKGRSNPNVTVKLMNQDGQATESISEKKLTSVGVPSPERVDFTNGVPVTAGVRYTISATLHEQNFPDHLIRYASDFNDYAHEKCRGSRGDAIVRNGSFTVKFHDSSKFHHGQIPQLYFAV